MHYTVKLLVLALVLHTNYFISLNQSLSKKHSYFHVFFFINFSIK